MNFKKIIFFLCFSASSGALFAQGYADDLLRYSRTTFGGTARTQGIAGAQTALGGASGIEPAADVHGRGRARARHR